ncbi:hypothetical protein [Litorivivens sp.]|uniref:hypothetical protein n=1 Tax=Litorivivens sp. TaxID=2020868 RepID=UPI003569F9B5
MKRAVIAILLYGFAVNTAFSHEASTSYLYWHSEQPNTLRLDLALTDVMLHLTPDTPSKLIWGELENQANAIARHVVTDIVIRKGQTACELEAELSGLTEYAEESFSVWQVHWQCPQEAGIFQPTTLDYRLLFNEDSLHRAVLTRHAPGMWLLPSGIQVLKPDSLPSTLLPPVSQNTAYGALAALLTAAVLLIVRIRRLSSRQRA